MKNKTEIKYALGFFMMTLLWMAMERLFGLHSIHIDKHATYTNLYAIPSIAIYVMALLEKRKVYNGIISYGQAFKSGLIMTVIITLLSPISQYLTSVYITPHYFENAINFAVTSGAMTQDAAISEFNLSNYLMYSVIGAPVMGLFTTAIVALLVRRKGN